MAVQIQLRRDSAADWTSANPTLAQGEIGFETDTNKIKIGNGTAAWNTLGYLLDEIVSLDELTDVTIYEPDHNQVLVYNESTSKWENENQVRIQTVASSATVTPNADTDDMVLITAQAAALLLANPSGNPRDGQLLVIRIKDNGTARAITFGSSYRAMGITLPTTTVLSKLMYLPMVYNRVDGKWDVFNVINEA